MLAVREDGAQSTQPLLFSRGGTLSSLTELRLEMFTEPDTGWTPNAAEAADIARELLGGVGTRFAHVLRAGSLAQLLAPLFDAREGQLLVAAATLHDIGYSPRLSHTGFHPLDGGIYLASMGFNRRLAGLVANHSLAYLNAPDHGIENLDEHFPRETSLLADALIAADMHSAPDGRCVRGEDRMADIAGRHTYPATTTRLKMLRQALARVAAALGAAGLPDLDSLADRGAERNPTVASAVSLHATPNDPDQSPVIRQHRVWRVSGSTTRLRVAATGHTAE